MYIVAVQRTIDGVKSYPKLYATAKTIEEAQRLRSEAQRYYGSGTTAYFYHEQQTAQGVKHG